MPKCAACTRDIPEGRTSCPACGTAFNDSLTPTQALPRQTPLKSKEENGAGRYASPASAGRSSISYDSIDHARFTPGTTVASRYRIVSLLGRGGMGEVYRADDLKLGQPVALKFLPEALQTDGAALARFHREVRVARQVSHRNVCRVYDIGEVGGQHFLSMEFIRGEELASLLRRIGRLPADKAVEIARQLCAGLAAAHDNGVLHRDLKPANVMIDSDGNVRITDFGLAGLIEEFREDELRAGTPAYMAPEQLAGEEVTVRSDIYSLGLVLYEVFTGKRAFDARNLEELLNLRKSETTPTSPSSHVKEIDPLVERVILRCLEREPRNRPASALQVAAALPGGDPLQAALAAGETPSPEMVAAAPKKGALRPAIAVALLASLVGLMVVACVLANQVALYNLVPLDKSPEILRERAREVVKKLGYTTTPVDSADGIYPDRNFLEYVMKNDSSRTRWNQLSTGQPAAFYFWYRQSRNYLITQSGMPTTSDPAETEPGMVSVILDPQGQLRRFAVVPPKQEAPPSADAAPTVAPPAPDWALLFAEAGFNPSAFQPVASTWTPPHMADVRAAWDGQYPVPPQGRVHVEAAAYRGAPVYFEVVNPWDTLAPQQTARESILLGVIMVVFVIVLAGSAFLALRNLRLGRGDRRGAFRLAAFFFTIKMLSLVFDSHHTATFDEFLVFIDHLKSSLFPACFLWVMYVALEPFVRRRWPEGIIAWSRLLAGDFRDPLVGRDILVGSLFGVGLILNNFMTDLAPKWLGYPPNMPFLDNQRLRGARYFLTGVSNLFNSSLFISFIFLFLLLLLLIVLRRKWLVAVAGWILYAGVLSLAISDKPPISLLFALTGALLYVGVLYRYGLLALVSAMFIFHSWVFLPITTRLTAWYAGDFLIALIIYAALALYAFYTSLAGQKLFRGGLLQD